MRAGPAAAPGGGLAVALPLVFAGMLGGVLGGCVVGPAYHPPTPPAVDGFARQPLPARTADAPGAVGTSGQAEVFMAGKDPRDE